MSDLFSTPPSKPDKPTPTEPLAARMRPRTLDEILGQDHILGQGKLLRRAIEADRFTSLIFYGPPGTGKTSLASVIATTTGSRFESLNGVESNVSEIREKISQAKLHRDLRGETTILFIDEIHRFNKAQQDVLLPHLERGTVRFIGATTHNPYFYINSPLVSRSQIFQLEPVSETHIAQLLQRALTDPTRGLGNISISADPEAIQHLAKLSDGDARKALTALELASLPQHDLNQKSSIINHQSSINYASKTTSGNSNPQSSIHITLADAEESIQKKAIHYGEDGHYNTISAFIKSIRGSDPDAALYWLAKMIHAGEDPRFISRRLIIAASEDIGLADSSALRIALDAHHALEIIGMPEGRIPLAHATVYLATSPKSNTAYAALGAATKDIESGKTLAVPDHLRTPTSKKLTGKPLDEIQYLYSHDYQDHYIPQAYLPEGRTYYKPSTQGLEKRIKERLDHWQQQKKQTPD